MNTLAVLGVVLGIIVIWAISFMRNCDILGKIGVNKRITQNLCKKYNQKVIRGKNGRFKSVKSPHIKKS
jgi:hypothetical protein|tara:strand:+ start:635 stop:841 length:207 start_codon:yes stop_codon:yes gene_type:complete